MDSNLAGGIVGGVLGVMGAVVGAFVSIKRTNGPKERAFVVRAVALGSAGVAAFLAVQYLTPFLWGSLLWLVYMPALWKLIEWGNARQARARAEDESDAGLPGHARLTR